MSGVPTDTCLQCEQSRAEVKANDTICGIEGGYEYVELEAEWPRHHWRDWSKKELTAAGIIEAKHGEYRRARLHDLEYATCEDTIRGHNLADHIMPDWGVQPGQCLFCGLQVAS